MTRNLTSQADNIKSEVMSVSEHSSHRVTSSDKDPDDVVNEMLSRRLWPWPIAVAYCLETGKRRQAIHDAAKVLTSYPYAGNLRHFTAMIAIECVFQVHVGAYDLPLDWEVMAELESLLLRGVESDDPAVHIPSYGSKIIDGDLVEISINDWVGSEILCSETADLIKVGFRVPELRETSVLDNKEPVTRFFNVHLLSKHVRQLVDRQAAKISTQQDGIVSCANLTVPIIERGTAGRRTSKQIVIAFLDERIGRGEVGSVLSVEAEILCELFSQWRSKPEHLAWPKMEFGTIQNAIRERFNEHKASLLS